MTITIPAFWCGVIVTVVVVCVSLVGVNCYGGKRQEKERM